MKALLKDNFLFLYLCNLIRFELNLFIIEKSHFNSIGWQTFKKRTLVSDIYI